MKFRCLRHYLSPTLAVLFLPWYVTLVLFFANGNSVISSTDISLLFSCYRRVIPGLCRPTFVTHRRDTG